MSKVKQVLMSNFKHMGAHRDLLENPPKNIAYYNSSITQIPFEISFKG